MDMHFTVEEKMVVGRIDRSPQELKANITKDIKRNEDATKLIIRSLRNETVAKIRKIGIITSSNDVRNMISEVDKFNVKYTTIVESLAADKAREMREA